MGRHNVDSGAGRWYVVPAVLATVLMLVAGVAVWVSGRRDATRLPRDGAGNRPGRRDLKRRSPRRPVLTTSWSPRLHPAPVLAQVVATLARATPGVERPRHRRRRATPRWPSSRSRSPTCRIHFDSPWLNLSVAVDLVPGAAPVLATSPLYFVTLKGTALPKTAASRLTLGDTLARRGKLRLVLSDPASSGAELVAAGALTDAGIDAHGPLVSALGLMRTWQAGPHRVLRRAIEFPTRRRARSASCPSSRCSTALRCAAS